jgi:hypothetical protein
MVTCSVGEVARAMYDERFHVPNLFAGFLHWATAAQSFIIELKVRPHTFPVWIHLEPLNTQEGVETQNMRGSMSVLIEYLRVFSVSWQHVLPIFVRPEQQVLDIQI